MVNDKSLWSNPPVPREMFTDEQLKKYEDEGKRLYDNMDFKNLESQVLDAVSYIVIQLRSGLDPDLLSEEEINIMNCVYGEDWKSIDFSYKDN